ncbi:MAG TPA: NrfD/PsrC family molybdoenzyme membrane anchor subunit [Baekduia sp.]|nr:NrfD/PsrC family molybdoenzyme membrane anchor subunit [Baekduia sp.]
MSAAPSRDGHGPARERPALGATRTAEQHGESPYGRPVIKEPVWTPEIPAYFYVGGLAGGSAALALLADLRGEEALARRAWLTAFAGSVVSPVLLISDLGVPKRFLHMLRMFKVTSPMSVGSWILAGFGTATAPATLHAISGQRLGAVGRGAQVASALLGLPLASYTAALITNTSVPAWHSARAEMPFVFTTGAALSAGAAALMLAPVEEAQAPRRLAVGGAAVELVLVHLMERRLEREGVGEAYNVGKVKWLNHAATWATAAGAAVVAARGRRSRRAAVVGGALLTAGAIAERFTIFRAGVQSARRPQDTVGPQRERIRRGASAGAARTKARRAPAQMPTGDTRPGERPVTPGSPAIEP